ncbi:MAG TPA: hypothetical protein VKV28_12390 [Candidatus Binataceae bacterium]|nr:hypothetical protein [Candidatus Binataceae bacterium]
MKTLAKLAAAAGLLAGLLLTHPGAAHAQYPGLGQGYTTVTPGQPPSFQYPNFDGGYTTLTPGKPPTFTYSDGFGGYSIITPGKPPSFVYPNTPLSPSWPTYGEHGGE